MSSHSRLGLGWRWQQHNKLSEEVEEKLLPQAHPDAGKLFLSTFLNNKHFPKLNKSTAQCVSLNLF